MFHFLRRADSKTPSAARRNASGIKALRARSAAQAVAESTSDDIEVRLKVSRRAAAREQDWQDYMQRAD